MHKDSQMEEPESPGEAWPSSPRSRQEKERRTIGHALRDLESARQNTKIVDVELAEQHALSQMCIRYAQRYDGTRQPLLYPVNMPFWKLARFGVGVGIYYRIVIYFGVLYAIASLGTIILAAFEFPGLVEFNPLLWFSAYSLREPDAQKAVVYGQFDMAVSILFLVLVWLFLPRLLSLWSLAIRKRNVSAAAFTVYVDWLSSETTAKDLHDYFSQWGRVQQVCTSAREEVFHSKLLARQQALEAYQRMLEWEESNSVYRRMAGFLERWGLVYGSEHWKARFFEADNDLRNITVNLPHNGHAFVTFEYIADKVRCVEATQFGRLRLYTAWLVRALTNGQYNVGVPLMDGQLIRVRPAPESKDIIWENLNYGSWDHLFREGATKLLALTIIAGSFIMQLLVVVWSQPSGGSASSSSSSSSGSNTRVSDEVLRSELEVLRQDSTGLLLPLVSSSLVLLVNKLMERLLLVFSWVEKHHTRSGAEDTFLNQLMWAQVLNAGVVVLMVHVLYPLWDSRTHNSWYDPQAGAHTVLALLMLNAFLPSALRVLAYYLLELRKVWLQPYRHTQASMNRLFEGPEFLLSRRFSTLGLNVFLTLMYSAAHPLAFIFGFLSVLCGYWADKYIMLRYTKRPAPYDETLAVRFVRNVKWALAFHAGMVLFLYNVGPFMTLLEHVLNGDGGQAVEAAFAAYVNAWMGRTWAVMPALSVLALFAAYFVWKNGLVRVFLRISTALMCIQVQDMSDLRTLQKLAELHRNDRFTDFADMDDFVHPLKSMLHQVKFYSALPSTARGARSMLRNESRQRSSMQQRVTSRAASRHGGSSAMAAGGEDDVLTGVMPERSSTPVQSVGSGLMRSSTAQSFASLVTLEDAFASDIGWEEMIARAAAARGDDPATAALLMEDSDSEDDSGGAVDTQNIFGFRMSDLRALREQSLAVNERQVEELRKQRRKPGKRTRGTRRHTSTGAAAVDEDAVEEFHPGGGFGGGDDDYADDDDDHDHNDVEVGRVSSAPSTGGSTGSSSSTNSSSASSSGRPKPAFTPRTAQRKLRGFRRLSRVVPVVAMQAGDNKGVHGDDHGVDPVASAADAMYVLEEEAEEDGSRSSSRSTRHGTASSSMVTADEASASMSVTVSVDEVESGGGRRSLQNVHDTTRDTRRSRSGGDIYARKQSSGSDVGMGKRKGEQKKKQQPRKHTHRRSHKQRQGGMRVKDVDGWSDDDDHSSAYGSDTDTSSTSSSSGSSSSDSSNPGTTAYLRRPSHSHDSANNEVMVALEQQQASMRQMLDGWKQKQGRLFVLPGSQGTDAPAPLIGQQHSFALQDAWDGDGDTDSDEEQ